jgi:hypothetical protein
VSRSQKALSSGSYSVRSWPVCGERQGSGVVQFSEVRGQQRVVGRSLQLDSTTLHVTTLPTHVIDKCKAMAVQADELPLPLPHPPLPLRDRSLPSHPLPFPPGCPSLHALPCPVWQCARSAIQTPKHCHSSCHSDGIARSLRQVLDHTKSYKPLLTFCFYSSLSPLLGVSIWALPHR